MALRNSGRSYSTSREQKSLVTRWTWSSSGLFVMVHVFAAVPGTAQSILQSWTAGVRVDYSYGVKAIGDVDGDGAAEVAVGDYGATMNGVANAGRLDIYSGRTGQTLLTLSGSPPVTGIAHQVHGVGDVDQDGAADLMFSAVENQNTLIFLVASGRSGAILWTFRNYDRAAAAGDIDGDGVPDFLLSDTQATVGGIVLAGRCDVVSGRTGAVINSFAGRAACDQLRGIGRAGDLDGDGTPDLLTESVVSCWSPGFFLHNGIWAYSGRSGQQLFYLPPASNTFGINVAGIGDFNADGFDDIAVMDYGPVQAGLYNEVTVYGGPGANVLFRHRYDRLNPGPIQFWDPLSAAGDIDGTVMPISE